MTLDDGEGWWCLECQGLGGWEESGEDVDFGDPVAVECPCCLGEGHHQGDYPPPCIPAAAEKGVPEK